MAEFKISHELSTEVSEFQSCGNSINEGYKSISDIEVATLDTSMNYIAQHKRIKKVFDLYKELVLKDAQDLKDMISEVEAMDNAIAEKNK